MSKEDILELLESFRLPEKTIKIQEEDVKGSDERVTVNQDHFMNDPAMYKLHEPFLIYDSNNETIISRTAKGINEGKLNPFEINWMEVTLYLTDFKRQLLEIIDSKFINFVAQAIDDEDKRHEREDGYYTEVISYHYGTGNRTPFQYYYKRENNNIDQYSVEAKLIAEEILDKRQKAEAYKKELEKQTNVDDLNEKQLPIPPCAETTRDNDYLIKQIEDLKDEISQLSREKAAIEIKCYDLLDREKKYLNEKEKNETEIKELVDKDSEKAFNATGNDCFTKAKMGLLIYTIATLTDGPIPVKAKLVSIISAIGGWEPTSLRTEINKAGFRQGDIDAVAKLFEKAMPNFASEIKKQIPRQQKNKK